MILRYLSVLSLLAVSLMLGSCGDTYTTYIRSDPLFTKRPLDTAVLPDQGEGYEKRGDYLVDAVGIQPSAGESYEDFSNRLVNTLIIQETDRETLTNLEVETALAIEDLQEQFALAELRNKQLRMEWQLVSDHQDARGLARMAFRPYYVAKGDTLQKIAKRAYGTYTAWLAVYQFNQYYLKDPNFIKEGDLIWLPAFNNM